MSSGRLCCSAPTEDVNLLAVHQLAKNATKTQGPLAAVQGGGLVLLTNNQTKNSYLSLSPAFTVIVKTGSQPKRVFLTPWYGSTPDETPSPIAISEMRTETNLTTSSSQRACLILLKRLHLYVVCMHTLCIHIYAKATTTTGIFLERPLFLLLPGHL